MPSNIKTQETFKSFSYDKRNCLYKLPTVINDLRGLGYQDSDPIPHDDVVYIIEISIGADHRTVAKYIRLLLRHDYLRKLEGAHPIYSTAFVQVRTKYTINTTEYKSRTPLGYSFYVFGPRAPQGYQKKLSDDITKSPPTTPPSESCEGCGQNYMCVSPPPHESGKGGHV